MTSYFAKPGVRQNPDAVSIALYTPRWWGKGRRFPALAPTRDMLKAGYDYEQYLALLGARGLDPDEIYAQLTGKIICCWEKSGKPCHRYMVAHWLASALGLDPIQELE